MEPTEATMREIGDRVRNRQPLTPELKTAALAHHRAQVAGCLSLEEAIALSIVWDIGVKEGVFDPATDVKSADTAT